MTKIDGSLEIFGCIADFERAYDLKSKQGYRIVKMCKKSAISSKMPTTVSNVEML